MKADKSLWSKGEGLAVPGGAGRDLKGTMGQKKKATDSIRIP